MMSLSLSRAPYSVGTCHGSLRPQKSNYSSSSSSSSPPVVFSTYNQHKTSSPVSVSVSVQPPIVLLPQRESESNPSGTHFKRRDALGFALSFGLLNAAVFQVQPPPPAAAAATDTAPCEFTVAPSGLAFCDKFVGTGPQALKGQLIKAHYVGKLENGKVFDSSYNRGKPLTFRVGVGEVIKGWDEGILGGDGVPPMLAGGKRTLKLPPELGYGSRGAGCKGGSCIIPPDSVLLFDVEFISKV